MAAGEGDEHIFQCRGMRARLFWRHVDRRHQLIGRAFRDDVAVVHDGYAVAELFRLVHVVRREHDRPALALEDRDQVPELPARLRIETGGRLVEEEQLGPADERAGEGEPLFLAAGEIRNTGAPFFLQLDEANHVAHGRALRVETPKEHQGLVHRELVGELRVLQLDAEALPKRGLIGRPAAAQKDDVPRIGRGQAFANLDGGRLAGAVRPEQAEAFAGADLQVDAVDSHHVAVRLAQAADLQGGCGDGHGPSII